MESVGLVMYLQEENIWWATGGSRLCAPSRGPAWGFWLGSRAAANELNLVKDQHQYSTPPMELCWSMVCFLKQH